MGGWDRPATTGGVVAASRRCALSILLPGTLFILPLIMYLQCSLPLYPSSSSASNWALETDPSSEVRALLEERGASLLHSWTDDELFDRAINATSSPLLINSPTNLLHNKDDILGKARKRWRSTSNFFLGRPKEQLGKRTPPSSRKIAFLFLTRGNLPFEALWNRFFRGNEALYNIYVHADPFRFDMFDRNKNSSSSSAFWGRLIPSRATERASPSLIAATRRLLANALLDDPANHYFAVLSDSCIPLHGFRRIYKRLLSSSQKSFMEVIRESEHLPSRYDARGEGVMLPEIPFDEFRVGSQWFVVTRRHAAMFVGDQKYWSKFKLPCLPESAFSCYPEEHYFSTVMNMEDPGGYIGHSVTHVNWPENTDGHPTTYHGQDVDRKLMKRLREEKDGRFLFARKFDADSADALLKMSDVIFKH